MFIAIYAVLFSLATEAVLGLTVEQKELSMTKEEGKSVYISCKVTGLATNNYLHWYQKKDGEGLRRILYVGSGSKPVLDNNHPEAKDFDVRIQSDNYALKIAELKTSHTAVYYCASWDGSGDWVKVFSSGTKLYVTDNSTPQQAQAPKVEVYPMSRPQSGKSVLLCQAREMFPDLVKFKWEAGNVDLTGNEKLEQRESTGGVQITSMLIVDEDKASKNTFTCTVEHETGPLTKTIEIPKASTSTENCPTPKVEDDVQEDPDESVLSRSQYLFSVTYTMLLVKNVLYFCTISVLLCKRKPATMEVIRGKVR
ncbi:uncharacterized protein LOC132893336 [Neoarius graeffei]|uniref:uncharacterized protein LOC132893336 n=1 Tax=Neoarius graeffei TaxID=443677 RepID=UPI00298BCCC7|nr:uncharacterized protein LOC132893336 [Neoarius graeffei]